MHVGCCTCEYYGERLRLHLFSGEIIYRSKHLLLVALLIGFEALNLFNLTQVGAIYITWSGIDCQLGSIRSIPILIYLLQDTQLFVLICFILIIISLCVVLIGIHI